MEDRRLQLKVGPQVTIFYLPSSILRYEQGETVEFQDP